MTLSCLLGCGSGDGESEQDGDELPPTCQAPPGTSAETACEGGPCDGSYAWSARLGGSGYSHVTGMAFKADGNLFVAGAFDETLDLPTGQLVSAGKSDVFLAEMAPSGALVSARSFGGPGDDFASQLVVDAAGDIVLAGHTDGTIDLGGGPLMSAAAEDIFVVKLHPDGSHVWSKLFGGPQQQLPAGLALAPGGDVVLAGHFAGTVDFGGGPLDSPDTFHGFVARLDADGEHVFSRSLGGATVMPRAPVVDGQGNVLLAGLSIGSPDLGGGVREGAGRNDVFVAKLDAAGEHVWSRIFGDDGNQMAHTVAVGPDGEVFVGLMVDSKASVDLGCESPVGVGWTVVVAAFDSAGAPRWSRAVAGEAGQEIYSMAADAEGNVLFGGSFTKSADFGGGPLDAFGDNPFDSDMFVAKLSGAGDHVWSKAFGDEGGGIVGALAVGPANQVVMSGDIQYTIDFGGGPLPADGASDAVVVELTP